MDNMATVSCWTNMFSQTDLATLALLVNLFSLCLLGHLFLGSLGILTLLAWLRLGLHSLQPFIQWFTKLRWKVLLWNTKACTVLNPLRKEALVTPKTRSSWPRPAQTQSNESHIEQQERRSPKDGGKVVCVQCWSLHFGVRAHWILNAAMEPFLSSA